MKYFVKFIVINLVLTNYCIANDEYVSKQDFQNLSAMVKTLEERIQALEGARQEQKAKPSNGSNKKANWRKLKRGMSFADVTELLGEPGKITTSSLGGQTWYYPNALGGRIRFDENSNVEEWSEP
jgi:hypothetical protein